MSCFLCGIDIVGDVITLTDTGKVQYFIDRKTASEETLSCFKSWFNDVYMKCVPATSTIVDYAIEVNKDGEAINVVKKLISPAMDKGAK